MRRAVVGPRAGAPWVRRGPGPGRHGGRPLAVTPSVHLRPRAGNPEKPPGGLFRVACRRAGPDRARTAAVGGPSSRAVRGLRPVRGQTNETFRRRNEKHPRRVKETETATPTTPETGKTKKQTSGRPALRGRMSPTPLGRPGCRGGPESRGTRTRPESLSHHRRSARPRPRFYKGSDDAAKTGHSTTWVGDVILFSSSAA